MYAALLGLILLSFSVSVSAADQLQQIVFSDPNLEAVVRDAVGKRSGLLTVEDALRLKRLDASECQISDLSGIERLQNLEYLNLRGNNIADLTPLAQLKNLTYLNLHSNTAISDLAPIGGLINLQTLILRNVPIGNQVDFLADLTKLQRLNINNTGISDLTVLGQLMACGALQDNPAAQVKAEVDLSNNPIMVSFADNYDGYAPIRAYWVNVSRRTPERLPELSGQHAVINEVMAYNARTKLDQDGEPSDWIELYNPTDRPIHLGGYYLSDSLNNLTKWSIPGDVWLEPGEYVLIWASGKDQIGSELHTNFRIDQTGEAVILTSRDRETIIDYFYVPSLKMDFSYGRQPDGGKNAVIFDRLQVSPGGSNNAAAAYAAPDPSLNPVFSHQGGFYKEPFMLTIEPVEGTTVYITLDGSVPDPINNPDRTYELKGAMWIPSERTPGLRRGIDIRAGVTPKPPLTHIITSYNNWSPPRTDQFKGKVIRARAYNSNNVSSEVITHTYFVDPQGFERHSVPVIAIAVDPLDLFDYEHGIYVPGKGFHEHLPWAYHKWGSGNFHGRGRHWERPIYIEFWEPGGNLAIAQNAGLRIHGDASRGYGQKSLRILASSDYDERDVFAHEIFPGRTVPFSNETYNEYKAFVLRNGGNTWYHTMLKDGLLANLLHHTKIDTQYFRPAVVYINGEYWGIHNIRDFQDEWYFYYKYGVDPEQIEIVEDNAYVNEGNTSLADPERQNYRSILQLIDPNYYVSYQTPDSLADPELYAQIKQLIDIDAYLDYVAVQICIQNHDWPGNNVRMWRLSLSENNPDAPYGHDGLWRWMIYDMDLAFDDFNANTLVNATRSDGTEWHNEPWATYLLRALLQNPEFRLGFINRCADHLNSTFLPEVVIAELDRIEAVMEPEMEEHIRRWNMPAPNIGMWKNQNSRLRLFAQRRPTAVRGHIIQYFGLTGMYQLTVKTDYTKGLVKVNSIDISPDTPGVGDPNRWTGTYFKDVPITLTAIPHQGQEFVGWIGVPEELQLEPTITIAPADSITIQALFI